MDDNILINERKIKWKSFTDVQQTMKWFTLRHHRSGCDYWDWTEIWVVKLNTFYIVYCVCFSEASLFLYNVNRSAFYQLNVHIPGSQQLPLQLTTDNFFYVSLTNLIKVVVGRNKILVHIGIPTIYALCYQFSVWAAFFWFV